MESLDVATADATEQEDVPRVSAQTTRPGRLVFTEEDNPDGWIGTDLTVDVRR